MSSWVLSNSTYVDFTTSLGNLLHLLSQVILFVCFLKKIPLCSDGISCILIFVCCTLSCHWALPRRACLPQLNSLLSGIYIHWWDPPESSLLHAKQSPLLESHMKDVPVLKNLHSLLLDLLQYSHVWRVLWSPQLDPELQMCVSSADQRGKITSLQRLMTLFLMWVRMLLAFFAIRVPCLLTVTITVYKCQYGLPFHSLFQYHNRCTGCIKKDTQRCQTFLFFFKQ